MATRGDKLNRLVIGSPCTASWEAMEGDGARRRCAECEKDVFDFARMTRREIEARLQASRGQLCVRLTRKEGQLVVAEEPIVPLPPGSWSRQRVSPFVATFVTAWLGLDARSARAGEPAAPSAAVTDPSASGVPSDAESSTAKPRVAVTRAAAIHGRIAAEGGKPLAGAEVSVANALDGGQYAALTSEDGSFLVDSLPSGIYDVAAEHEGFLIEARREVALQAGESRSVDLAASVDLGEVTAGAMAVAAEPLRQLFAEGDLVVLARVGPSIVRQRNGDYVDLETELQLETILKGEVRGHRVRYRHSEDGNAISPDGSVQGMAPGVRVLAFLVTKGGQGAKGPETYFKPAGSYAGVRVVDGAEREVYLKRLEGLAKLERQAGRGGGVDAGALMEWLVATAEDPMTRVEAVGEISQAYAALRDRARLEGTTEQRAAQDLEELVERFRAEGGTTSEDPRPAVLGAALTRAQQKRLSAALEATKRLDEGDLDLFGIVRQWDEAGAKAWLVRQLRTLEPDADGESDFWKVQTVAYQLEDDALQEIVQTAEGRFQEIDEQWPEDAPEPAAGLRHKERAIAYADFLRDFAHILAAPR